jgi:hypothetical protein
MVEVLLQNGADLMPRNNVGGGAGGYESILCSF